MASTSLRASKLNHVFIGYNQSLLPDGLCGAMVARLTPDQKVACSTHVRVIELFIFIFRSRGSEISRKLTQAIKYKFRPL